MLRSLWYLKLTILNKIVKIKIINNDLLTFFKLNVNLRKPYDNPDSQT